jgi:hypothetical protein
MYLDPTAYQSHHTNGKQQMGVNISVSFCVGLWLIIRVHLRLFISLGEIIPAMNFHTSAALA